MNSGSAEMVLVDQLLHIAHDPNLRQLVYERLGDYCHQCRNRLNSLKLSIYLAMKQAPPGTVAIWFEVDRHYRDLEKRVEQVQLLCRPMTLTRVTLGLNLLIDDRREAWTRSMRDSGKAITFVPPSEQAIASFDVERMGGLLDSVVAWRSLENVPTRSAIFRWWVEEGQAHILWEEPINLHQFGDEGRSEAGTEWILPILARVILAHGGNYRIESERGWSLKLAWPTHPPTP